MLVELSWNRTCGFGIAVKKVMNPWDSLEESKENDQRSGKNGLPDQRGKQKESFTLCCPLEKRNSLKLQQRRVRLGIRSNILKIEKQHPVTGSFQERAGHASLRSDTGLADSAMGQWREFAGFLMSLTH